MDVTIKNFEQQGVADITEKLFNTATAAIPVKIDANTKEIIIGKVVCSYTITKTAIADFKWTKDYRYMIVSPVSGEVSFGHQAPDAMNAYNWVTRLVRKMISLERGTSHGIKAKYTAAEKKEIDEEKQRLKVLSAKK